MELSSLNEDQAGLLEQVFWDMVLLSPRLERIEGENYSEESLFLSAGTRSPEEMASVYNFTGAQKKALSALLAHPEITDRWLCDLTSQTPEAAALLSALPGDLSPERRAVVEVACSLVGKVNYFWGGKSRVLGWDSPLGRSTEGNRIGQCQFWPVPSLWLGLLRLCGLGVFQCLGRTVPH